MTGLLEVIRPPIPFAPPAQILHFAILPDRPSSSRLRPSTPILSDRLRPLDVSVKFVISGKFSQEKWHRGRPTEYGPFLEGLGMVTEPDMPLMNPESRA